MGYFLYTASFIVLIVGTRTLFLSLPNPPY
jgi:hypothetical protein